MSHHQVVDLDGALLSILKAVLMIPALFIVFFLLILVSPDTFWAVTPYVSPVGSLLIFIGGLTWISRPKRGWIWVMILGCALLMGSLAAEVAVEKVQAANVAHGYFVQHEPDLRS